MARPGELAIDHRPRGVRHRRAVRRLHGPVQGAGTVVVAADAQHERGREMREQDLLLRGCRCRDAQWIACCRLQHGAQLLARDLLRTRRRHQQLPWRACVGRPFLPEHVACRVLEPAHPVQERDAGDGIQAQHPVGQNIVGSHRQCLQACVGPRRPCQRPLHQCMTTGAGVVQQFGGRGRALRQFGQRGARRLRQVGDLVAAGLKVQCQQAGHQRGAHRRGGRRVGPVRQMVAQ